MEQSSSMSRLSSVTAEIYNSITCSNIPVLRVDTILYLLCDLFLISFPTKILEVPLPECFSYTKICCLLKNEKELQYLKGKNG